MYQEKESPWPLIVVLIIFIIVIGIPAYFVFTMEPSDDDRAWYEFEEPDYRGVIVNFTVLDVPSILDDYYDYQVELEDGTIFIFKSDREVSVVLGQEYKFWLDSHEILIGYRMVE